VRSTPRSPRLAQWHACFLVPSSSPPLPPLPPPPSSSSPSPPSPSSSLFRESSGRTGSFRCRKSTCGNHVNRVQFLSLSLATGHSRRLVPLRRIGDSWPASCSVRAESSRGWAHEVSYRRYWDVAASATLVFVLRDAVLLILAAGAEARQPWRAAPRGRFASLSPPLCHCVPPRVLPGEGCLVLSLMTPTDDCDDRGRDNQHRSPLTVPYHYDSRLARSSSPIRLLQTGDSTLLRLDRPFSRHGDSRIPRDRLSFDVLS